MTIPPALLKLMDLDVGAQVTLSVERGKLVALTGRLGPQAVFVGGAAERPGGNETPDRQSRLGAGTANPLAARSADGS